MTPACDQPPGGVRLFSRMAPDLPARLRALYSWADERRLRVLGLYVADRDDADRPETLIHAVAECARDGAPLIVSNVADLGPEATRRWCVDNLGSATMLEVEPQRLAATLTSAATS